MTEAAQATRQTKGSRQAEPATVSATAPVPAPANVEPGRFVLRQYANNSFFGIAKAGTLPGDYELKAGPWEAVARNITRFDDARLVCADDSWCADYVCVDVAPGSALFRLVSVISLPPRQSSTVPLVPEGHEIVPGGVDAPQPGWLVWRKAQGDQGAVLLNAGHVAHTFNEAREMLLRHAAFRGDTSPTIFGKPATF